MAYRTRPRDGPRVVLKIAPPAGVEVMTYERDMMRTEVHALGLIRRHTAVAVPAVHHYDAGRQLCDADYFFMEYVDADILGVIADQLPPVDCDRYAEAVGAVNRQLNQIKGGHFGPLLGGDPGASWRQVFTGMVEDVLRDGQRRGVDIGFDYDLVRAVFVEHAPSLDEVTEPVFVEWDLWDSNVMVRDGAIVAIIDHERAFYGDPFVRGYGRAPVTEAERLRRRLYNIHLILIMMIETVFRGHTDPRPYQQAKARMAGLLADFGHGRSP